MIDRRRAWSKVAFVLALFAVAPRAAAKDVPYPSWATPGNVATLLAAGDPTVLLGGGIGVASWRDGSLRMRFLERAAALDRDSPIMALSMADVMIVLSAVPGPTESRRLETVALALRSSAPDNAAGDFLLAFVAMTRGDAERALHHLHDGNGRTTFETYSRERFRAIVAAGEAVGVESAEARDYAFGMLVPTHIMNALIRTCRWLRDGRDAQAGRSECLAAGQLADRGAHTLLESLFAMTVQYDAVLCNVGDVCLDHRKRRRVAERRRFIRKLCRAIDTEPASAKPPPAFYDAVIARGEEPVAVDRICSKHAPSRLCAALAGA